MGDLGQLLLGGGVGAILATLINALVNRRKLGADTASVLSKTALELIQPLRDQIKELNSQLDRVTVKANNLELRLDDCTAANVAKDEQIALLRARPPVTPSASVHEESP